MGLLKPASSRRLEGFLEGEPPDGHPAHHRKPLEPLHIAQYPPVRSAVQLRTLRSGLPISPCLGIIG